MKLNNIYYILRHGEALSNVKDVMSCWPEPFENPLTVRGRQVVAESAATLKNKNVDLIVSSDILRATQTARIAAKVLKVEVIFDERLRELGFGVLNGKSNTQMKAAFPDELARIDQAVPGGETYLEAQQRVEDFLREIDQKHTGKTILIISHECPLWVLWLGTRGIALAEAIKMSPQEGERIKNGEIKKLNY